MQEAKDPAYYYHFLRQVMQVEYYMTKFCRIKRDKEVLGHFYAYFIGEVAECSN